MTAEKVVEHKKDKDGKEVVVLNRGILLSMEKNAEKDKKAIQPLLTDETVLSE